MRGINYLAVAAAICLGCDSDTDTTELPEPYPGTLRDSAGKHSDRFGSAMATNGDVLAVGAPMADTAGPDSGHVVVYSIGEGVLPELTRLVRPDSAPQWGDSFGAAIALEGSRLAVGAPGVDAEDGQDAGAVFIFDGSSGDWLHDETIQSPLTERDQSFGSSVSISGELLFVGAAGADLEERDVGAVFTFRRESDGYVPVENIASRSAD